MGNLFSLDNKFGQFMDKLGKLMILNLICLICSIPVVTMGTSVTAMFSVLFQMEETEDISIVKTFFCAFRENFRQSFCVHLFMLLVTMVLLFELYYCNQLRVMYEVYQYWMYLSYVVVFVYLMILVYVYPLLSKFENSLLGTLRNALLLSVTHIGWTVLVIVITVVPFVICFINTTTMQWGMLFFLLCGFAVIAFINAKIFRRIFAKYTQQEMDAKNDERKS